MATETAPRMARVSEAGEQPMCFICFEGEGDSAAEFHERSGGAAFSTGHRHNDSTLVSPCACRGSAAFVHIGCLKKWHLNLGNPTSLTCPTCEQQYIGEVAEELARLNLERVRQQDLEPASKDTQQAKDTQQLSEATALDHLGQVLSGQGRYEEALDLFQQSLTTKISIVGEEMPTVANSLDNVAELYRTMGEYEDALALKKEALRIRKKVLGLEHTDTATSYNNIGLVLQNMGRLEHAKPFFKKAVKTYEAVSNKDTTNMAAMLNNLAGSYRFQGKLEEAEQLYQRSLAMRMRVLGPNRPAVAESLNNLAMVLKDAGKFDQAEDMSRKCLELAKKLMAPDRPGYLNYVGNHGIVLLAMGKEMETGKAHILEALNGLLRRGFPDTHVWVQKFRKHLVMTEHGAGACTGDTASCKEEPKPHEHRKRLMGRVASTLALEKLIHPKRAQSPAHQRSIENCRPSPVPGTPGSPARGGGAGAGGVGRSWSGGVVRNWSAGATGGSAAAGAGVVRNWSGNAGVGRSHSIPNEEEGSTSPARTQRMKRPRIGGSPPAEIPEDGGPMERSAFERLLQTYRDRHRTATPMNSGDSDGESSDVDEHETSGTASIA